MKMRAREMIISNDMQQKNPQTHRNRRKIRNKKSNEFQKIKELTEEKTKKPMLGVNI